MRRSKRFIVGVAVVVLILVGSIAGVVVAQTGGGNGDTSGAQHGALLNRICEIYEGKTGVALDREALEDAFIQARGEMRDAALETRLQSLVEQGKITQQEADQVLEWWQAKPDTQLFREKLKGWHQARPEVPPELKDWWQAKPDVLPGLGGMRQPRAGMCPCRIAN